MLIGDLIRRRAAISPHQEFWRDEELSISYDQLNRDANRIARAILSEGLVPGDHVAICAGNGYEYAAIHFGAAKAGVVLTHLNPRLTAVELTRLCTHSEAMLVFFGEAQQTVMDATRDSLPRVRKWIQMLEDSDDPVPGWAESVSRWILPHTEEEPDLSRFSVQPGAPPVFPEAPFQMLYTSGTTGFPKGVLISHRAKLAHGTTHVINTGLQPGDQVWSALPLYHQFAQWLALVCVPMAGATLFSANAFDPGKCWEALRNEGITHLPAVPTMLYRLLDHDLASGAPPADLRCIVYGGAPMDAGRITTLRVCFPGARLFQGFGQTEVGYCLGLHNEDHQQRPESLGKADLFSEILLVNEQGGEVAPGEVGELIARTPYLMNGYHKDPAATEAFFQFGVGWGRTGDLATRDAEGYFTLAGRKVDMIISGGVNIYPMEIEKVLEAHPAVAEVAVIGIPDDDMGESVHAVVVLNSGHNAGDLELTSHCREQLAGFKVPRSFTYAESLPKTHTGKIRKVELRESFWSQYN